jgi:hypothetical protein
MRKLWLLRPNLTTENQACGDCFVTMFLAMVRPEQVKAIGISGGTPAKAPTGYGERSKAISTSIDESRVI